MSEKIPPGHCENPSCIKVWATLAGRKDYQQGVEDGRAEMVGALKQIQIIVDAQGGMDRLGISIAKLIAKAEGGQSC